MHYNVLTSRTFHHRITRYLGVLVGAALLVALGLPGVAQAQVPAAPTAQYFDVGATPDSFTVTTAHSELQLSHDFWAFESDSPSASAEMMAVASVEGESATLEGIQVSRAEGKWTFRVRTFLGCGTTPVDAKGMCAEAGPADPSASPPEPKIDDVTASTRGAIRVPANTFLMPDDYVVVVGTPGSWSAKTPYTHGAPPMPENFNYLSRAGTDTHIFSWSDAAKGDDGIVSYTLRWSYGDPTLLATKWEMEEGIDDRGLYTLDSDQTAKLMDGKMYTFELRAIGESSSILKTDPESDPATYMVPIGMVPTPTLPELAALFLALLLLGSGAYLLRGRQLTGLTRA